MTTSAEQAAFWEIDSTVLAFPELQDLPYYPFEYPDSIEHPLRDSAYGRVSTMIVHPLALFFERLAAKDQTELIRVLHYGDSQIEGDRITAVIRHYLQTSFGGYGMGAVPLFSPVNFSSYVVEKSKKWNRKFVTDPDPENSLSAWMGYLQGDSEGTATVTLRIAPYISEFIAYPKARYFSQIKILTSNTQNPEKIRVLDRLQKNHKFSMQDIGTHLSLTTVPFDTAQNEVKLEFENAESVHIHGVSLESKQGVIVDNIPIRGSFGNIFSQQKASVLLESFQLLNTKLILFQFGVNAVPNNPKDPVNTKALEDALVKELKFFKLLMPHVPIIVIGVSDRAYKNGEIYETNPQVKLVREVQKNAAFRAECVFWDLYQAMGGENSMVDWVNQNPPLAGKDYTHFSPKGAQRVGEMFYKSLMIEYLKYLKHQKEQAIEQLTGVR